MSHSDDAGSRLAAAVVNSRVVVALERVDNYLSSFGRSGRTEHLAARGRRVVSDSYVYRWLTAEPEPEVIVIDLRETYTVGPFVAVLDRVGRVLDVAATSSRMVATARSLLAEFRAAPVRLVGVTVALGCAGALLMGSVLGELGVLSTVGLAILAIMGLAGTQVTASWADLVDSQIGRLVIAAFEPPAEDPPDDDRTQ